MRSLWKNPGFSILAILVMGLGICANTAVFSVVNSVLLTKMLFQVKPTDPATYAAVAVLLAAIAAAACYFPARRATQVDPLVALRQD